ncbi:MAG: 50S ribosomal protein L13 [Candidatus Eisenbacteria bacterium]|uniref:Large ribosomal subunit protein uL13 n=1 Tax=Eiseniibacteriota bacterium TaxID=2212470 RepID=A0A948RT52_UNCEI|nr:50S ribosomal protein L13 [Candidatus Eisenbacteria bacterium]MBU1950732.1 50S ribosomal protein L13 [Candidatus Eisenbacteria bacterium]MBU2690530.1 50S ribosomal protein L13 [Candidatus Eisenbacteria bacterium]
MKTHATKAGEIQRKWYLVDAEGEVLGRMASEVAGILRGKWKRNYVPYLDVGDHVIIINAAKVKITGNKLEQESHFRHSGYPGGEKFTPWSKDMENRPEELVRRTVWGMLSHNALGRAMVRKLKVYPGAEHPHQAQNPIPLKPGAHGHFLEAVGETTEES